MDHQEFMATVDKALIDCKRLLDKKRLYREGPEGDDRLYQFKIATALTGRTLPESVGGMMVKHTTQLFEMLQVARRGEPIPVAKWKETIYDSINYHLLLLATLKEFYGE